MNKKILFFGFLSLIIGAFIISVTFTSHAAEEIYVEVDHGSDQDGDGSQSNPYKTITKAVQVANTTSNHNTIHIKKGVYNLTSGEDFPLTVENIDLIGDPDDLEAVKVAGKMTIKNSKVQGIHFYREVEVREHTSLKRNAFSKSPRALRVLGSCRIVNNHFNDNREAIHVPIGGIESLTITDNTFSHASHAALDIYCGNNLLIASNRVEGNDMGYNIEFANPDCHAEIRDNEVSSDIIGIRLEFSESSGEVTLEGNKIASRSSLVITGSSSAIVDLGKGLLESEGDNTFQASEYYIKYELPPYNGEIYAKNNAWKDAYGNTFAPPTTLEGETDTDHFYIENEGNKIVFSD